MLAVSRHTANVSGKSTVVKISVLSVLSLQQPWHHFHHRELPRKLAQRYAVICYLSDQHSAGGPQTMQSEFRSGLRARTIRFRTRSAHAQLALLAIVPAVPVAHCRGCLCAAFGRTIAHDSGEDRSEVIPCSSYSTSSHAFRLRPTAPRCWPRRTRPSARASAASAPCWMPCLRPSTQSTSVGASRSSTRRPPSFGAPSGARHERMVRLVATAAS